MTRYIATEHDMKHSYWT